MRPGLVTDGHEVSGTGIYTSEKIWRSISGEKETLLPSSERAGLAWRILQLSVDFLHGLPAIPADWILWIHSIHHSVKQTCSCSGTCITNEEPGAENWVSGNDWRPSPEKIIRRVLFSNHVPLIVTNSLFFSKEDLPHWVTVTGIDDKFLYFNNPSDGRPRKRRIGLSILEEFIGYRGAQSIVEVWKE